MTEHGAGGRGDAGRVVYGSGGGDLLVRVERIHQATDDGPQVGASREPSEHGPVIFGQVLVQPGQASSDRRGDLRILVAERDLLEQVLALDDPPRRVELLIDLNARLRFTGNVVVLTGWIVRLHKP